MNFRGYRLYFLGLMVSLMPQLALGQEEDVPQRRFFFGGNFDLMFGTVTNINISPLVGYRVTPRLSAGVGLTYEYYRKKLPTLDIFQTSIYGARTFVSYDLIKDFQKSFNLPSNGALMAYGEYEVLNWNYYQAISRIWLNNVYAGGGLRFPIGENSSFQILVLWNLNLTYESPFSNPLVRFGFNF